MLTSEADPPAALAAPASTDPAAGAAPAPDAAEGGAGLAGADLRAALDVVAAVHRHLLSAGEVVVLRRLLSLTAPALGLTARLLARRDRLLPVDGLRYADVMDPAAAVAELHALGLVSTTDDPLPVGQLCDLHDVEGLKRACAALGLPRSGDRAQLAQRLRAAGLTARAPLLRPGVRLRHRALLRRWCGWYLLDHEGDLSRLVIERLGVTRAPTYTPTDGPSLHPCRRAVGEAEQARAAHVQVLAALGDLGPTLRQPMDLDTLRRIAADARVRLRPPWPLHPTQRRWSAARAAARTLGRVAAALERQHAHGEALELYALLADDRSEEPGRRAEAALRGALCDERLERAAGGAARCAAAMADAPDAHRLALERTGSRLARAARVPWTPLRPLQPLRERRLKLDLLSAPAVAGRPAWWLALDGESARPAPIEDVVATVIGARGREVLFAENGPWTTIFGLLFFDVLFMPVWGALPGPLLSAPLDLGTPGFYAARAAAIEARLELIAHGGAVEALDRAWEAHAGAQIRGVSWTGWSRASVRGLCVGLGGPALAEIMRRFALDHRGAGRGMPDLVVLPGAAGRLDGLFPGTLPAGMLLVEVKGPGDALRDEQRIWMDRLERAGAVAEVWWVEPSAGPPR